MWAGPHFPCVNRANVVMLTIVIMINAAFDRENKPENQIKVVPHQCNCRNRMYVCMFQTLSDNDSNNAALEIQCRAPYNVKMPLDSVSNTQLNSEKVAAVSRPLVSSSRAHK